MSDMSNYAGPLYEYASLMEIIGVTTENLADPPYVSAFGVTITPTTSMIDALNELGGMGWNVHSTTSMPFGDGQIQALVFMVLSRRLN